MTRKNFKVILRQEVIREMTPEELPQDAVSPRVGDIYDSEYPARLCEGSFTVLFHDRQPWIALHSLEIKFID